MSGFLVELINFFDSFGDSCVVCRRLGRHHRRGSVPCDVTDVGFPPHRCRRASSPAPSPTPLYRFSRSQSVRDTVYGSAIPCSRRRQDLRDVTPRPPYLAYEEGQGEGQEERLLYSTFPRQRRTHPTRRLTDPWPDFSGDFTYEPYRSQRQEVRGHSASPLAPTSATALSASLGDVTPAWDMTSRSDDKRQAAMTSRSNNNLSLDALLNMSPMVGGVDLVKSAARHLFLSYIKGETCVREAFFPAHQRDGRYEQQIDPGLFHFRRFACLFAAQAVCKSKDEYQMHSLLLEVKVEQLLEEVYSSPHWKKLGFALYTMLFKDLVKDETTKLPFSAYLNSDSREWARRLSERVRHKQWVYGNLISPVVRGQTTNDEYNRDLNLLFVKLHLLDPTSVMPIFDYFRKALPDLNLELVTTNYLGPPLDWRLIQQDVQAALQKPTFTSAPRTGSRGTTQDVEVFYGLGVLEFIMQDAKEMGLWTGKDPDNRRITQVRDRCTIM